MTDRPIIFSSPMVQALLAGRKTMTRRLASSPLRKAKVGDRLYVRENFAYVGTTDPGFLTFAATYPNDLEQYGIENVPATLKESGYKWTPCIHMPRRLSRLTLVITGTKVEKLQDINEADARAEGCGLYVPGHGWITQSELECDPGYSNFLAPRMGFEDIWRTLHGDESWQSNPDVVALTFGVYRKNIDEMEAVAA